MDELLTYCKKPNQDNCLIIIVDKFDQKSVLINKLSKVAVTVNTSSPFTNAMKDWVTILAIKYSTKMTQKAKTALQGTRCLVRKIKTKARAVTQKVIINPDMGIRGRGYTTEILIFPLFFGQYFVKNSPSDQV